MPRKDIVISVVKIIVFKKKKNTWDETREGLPNVIVYWFVFHFKLYYSLKIILYIAYTYTHTHSHTSTIVLNCTFMIIIRR